MNSLIVEVIHRYEPTWEPPTDNGYEWVSCLCPFHPDTNRSASVSYNRNAFHCFACPAKGDVIALIRQQEGVTFEAAKRIAEDLSEDSYECLSPKPSRKPSRRTFAGERTGAGNERQVQVGVRGRTGTWA